MPNKMRGIFSLITADDLFKKIEHDFELVCKNPGDPYAAFNFFVTAEHMLDWQYPGDKNKKLRNNLHNSEIILQVCSHLANGAKHFITEAKHHKSVSDTPKKVVFDGGALPKNSLPIGALPAYSLPGKWSDELFIELSGDAAIALGDVIRVETLAERILIFWRNILIP